MAYTKLADVLVRELWTNDFIDESPELQNILNSGLLTKDGRLDSVVNAVDAGNTFELPFIADPDYSEPAIMDDSTNEITPGSVEWANQFAMLGLYAKAWSEATLIKALSTDDPVAFIRDNYIAKYWAMDLQRRTVKTVQGVSADNLSNDNSDLTNDVADDSSGGADVLLDADILIDTKGLVGDKQDEFEHLFVHSKVYNDLQKKNLIQTVIPSEGMKPIRMYGDYRIFVNDLLPVIQGTNKKQYVSVIVQRGAFAYSEKNLPSDMPAIDYAENKLAGNGAGQRTIITRRGLVLHPIGWSFDKSAVAGQSPTLAELANGNAWDRKFRQKNSKFVFVITN